MQRAMRLACTLGLFACVSACHSDPPSSTARPRPQVAALPAGAPLSAVAALKGGVATAVGDDGVPRFVWAASRQVALPGQSAAEAARFHLRRYAPALAVDAPVIERAELAGVRRYGEAVLARLRQRLDGVEIYGGGVKVLMRGADHALVAISGRLWAPVLAPAAGRARFDLRPEEALARALGATFGASIAPDDARPLPSPSPEDLRFGLAPGSGVQLGGPARVKKAYFPDGDRLEPAWLVEAFAGVASSPDTDAHRTLVSAVDGRVLERRDLTQHDGFQFRVWADANGRPLDGPHADYTPHPTGTPDRSRPAFIAPSLVTGNGFNHNPVGMPDPWLDPGAVETRGYNVDAYSDNLAPDGYSNGDLRATVTAEDVFDHTYDTAAAPTANQTQTMAAAVQAFYVINWLHDYYYDSGFDEAAGNAQLWNYNRGGAGGDPIRAEIQDGYTAGQRSNANMSTPSDGLSPRMQLYVWDGPETRKVQVGGSDLEAGGASFGAKDFELDGEIVVVEDGTAPTSDGCEALVNAAAVTGKIAVVDRGTCPFALKVKNAQDAGAIGALVVDNADNPSPPSMGGDDESITIPVLSIRKTDGDALRGQLAGGPLRLKLSRRTDVERDGALDSTIVAHEWGHYLHHRLADCARGQCRAMSEGWGDFVALHLALREGDDLDGTFALATYATAASTDAGYFGIRRFPYSVDFTKNGLTLQHIADGAALPPTPAAPGAPRNSEVHNAGEVWAQMMFEAYVALQKGRGSRSFEEVQRRMGDYVVAGLQLTPPDATFTEQRDAVLAAAAARDMGDFLTIAQAFARRGAGSCAVPPPRASTNFVGLTESYELKPRLEIGAVRLDDGARSCDGDGTLDAGERGHLRVAVINAGALPMKATTVTVSTPTDGLHFPGGASLTLAEIPPMSTAEATFEVEADETLAAQALVDLKVVVENPEACTTTVDRQLVQPSNFDDVAAAARVDTVESAITAWARTGFGAGDVWARQQLAPASHAWVGTDVGFASDTSLESPELVVGSAPFTVTFAHRYAFESDPSEPDAPVYYDGAVIELSTDGGKTWRDVSTWVNPGYVAPITNTSNNPLADRPAFVGRNPGWPMRDTVTLDFGTALSGQTVKLRFRIATDVAAGDYGWELDDLAFGGITNTPFSALVDDAGTCGLVCPAGLAACGDACVHLSTDGANCGACGHACPAGSVCSGGTCAVSCQAGLSLCDGLCTNLLTDSAHCGVCGHACEVGWTCQEGTCRNAPPAPSQGGCSAAPGADARPAALGLLLVAALLVLARRRA